MGDSSAGMSEVQLKAVFEAESAEEFGQAVVPEGIVEAVVTFEGHSAAAGTVAVAVRGRKLEQEQYLSLRCLDPRPDGFFATYDERMM